MMEKARRLGAWGVEAAGPSEKSQDSYQTGSAPDTQKGLKLEEQVLWRPKLQPGLHVLECEGLLITKAGSLQSCSFDLDEEAING